MLCNDNVVILNYIWGQRTIIVQHIVLSICAPLLSNASYRARQCGPDTAARSRLGWALEISQQIHVK